MYIHKRGKNMELKRGKCADFGVSSKALLDFIDRNEREGLGTNSIMLIKDDTVVAEGYYSPYSANSKQVMYSISKSITATALGFAIAEGKIDLNDSICKFFGEYDKYDRNRKVTVRHLVTMTAGKMVGMAKNRHGKDWIKIFFDAPFVAKPGSMFMYVNDNFYLLSAIISKVYGETLVDFLYPRLFAPLGIEKPVWETDSFGYASGGWGLYLSTEDLAKIMYCYSKMGKIDGKQIIPREWIEQATIFQVPTTKKGQIDVTKGYGYGFWQTSLPECYRAYGLYGQEGYVFKKDNAVLILTAAISKDMYQAAAVNNMYKSLFNNPTPEYDEALEQRLASLGDKDNLSAGERNTKLEQEYNQKTIKTVSNGFVSMLNATITTVMDKSTGCIDRFSFSCKGDDLYLLWKEQTYVNEIKLGMNNQYEISKVSIGGIDFDAYTKASWVNDNKLVVVIRFGQTCHERRLEFLFKDKGVIIKNTSYPTLPELAAHYVNFSGIELPNGINTLLEKVIAPAILMVGEQNFISLK